jgi:DNA-binding CsgD family transcriptional regulator
VTYSPPRLAGWRIGLPMAARTRAHLRCLRTMSHSANTPRARRGDPLTPREIEILALVAAGEPTAEIAARLAISENTVKGHLTHVYTKTGSRNRVQATRHYLDHYATPATSPTASQPVSNGGRTDGASR